MNVAELDARNGAALARCLQWLRMLLKSPSVTWSPGQRDACNTDLHDAEALFACDLLTLAHEATLRNPAPHATLKPKGCACGPVRHWECNAGCRAVMRAIVNAEDEAAAAIRRQEAQATEGAS